LAPAAASPGTTETTSASRSKSQATVTRKLNGNSRSVNFIDTPATCPTVLTRGEKSSSDDPHFKVSRGEYSLIKRERESVLPSTHESAAYWPASVFVHGRHAL